LLRINRPILIEEKYLEMQLEKKTYEKEEADFKEEFELKSNFK